MKIRSSNQLGDRQVRLSLILAFTAIFLTNCENQKIVNSVVPQAPKANTYTVIVGRHPKTSVFQQNSGISEEEWFPTLVPTRQQNSSENMLLRDFSDCQRGDELELRMQCERPFAAIKHVIGVRQFLHRGLDKVRNEWNWLASAFNLQRMVNIIGARPGPDLQRHP